MRKPLQDRITDAEQRCGCYLAAANEASERGQTEKAEKLFAKSQFWRDRMNLLSGDGDRPAPRR